MPNLSKPKIQIPHPVVLLFGMLCGVAFLSYLIPAGQFQRVMLDGRDVVVPGTYQTIPATPIGFMDIFLAMPKGFKGAIEIIFIILSSGIMFGFLQKSGAIEQAVGTLIFKTGRENATKVIVLVTFIYGFLGVFVGYENNIALVPIAAILSIALGGDLLLAAGMSVGAITIGFGLSPFNAYTVGTGHKLAGLPMFSGYELRTVLCLIGLLALSFVNVKHYKKNKTKNAANLSVIPDDLRLSKPLDSYQMNLKDGLIISLFVSSIILILIGVFRWSWYINELSAVFCMLAILLGIVGRYTTHEIGETVLSSVAVVAPGAFMVGLAGSIRILLEQGNMNDTIAFHLSEMLQTGSASLSAVIMVLVQSAMNFLIPSGSGQALATLPVMIPVGEVIGLTRQTTILAFQIGDGLTNLVNPSFGGIMAMLSLCRVPFDEWLRFISPLLLVLMLVASLFVVGSVYLNYGPF